MRGIVGRQHEDFDEARSCLREQTLQDRGTCCEVDALRMAFEVSLLHPVLFELNGQAFA
jgi:hypothetical protein